MRNGTRVWSRGVAQRLLAASLSVALLGGALMVTVIANPFTQSADAAGNAVVPNSAITGFVPVPFAGNDDGTVSNVPLGFNINFFGTRYATAFVNNNGNVTFDGALSDYTPFGLESTTHVIIAPFFADVDTRTGTTANYGTGILNGHSVFVVNWPGVRCFGGPTTATNDFQLILVDRPDRSTGLQGDDFDIEFNYNSVQWDTGHSTQSGGNANCLNPATPTNAAAVGYSNGTNTPGDSFELPGSRTANAFLDTNPTTGLINNSVGSNTLGQYLFDVHNGQPVVAPNVSSTRAASSVTPGTDAAWTVTVTNPNDSILTGVSATVQRDRERLVARNIRRSPDGGLRTRRRWQRGLSAARHSRGRIETVLGFRANRQLASRRHARRRHRSGVRGPPRRVWNPRPSDGRGSPAAADDHHDPAGRNAQSRPVRLHFAHRSISHAGRRTRVDGVGREQQRQLAHQRDRDLACQGERVESLDVQRDAHARLFTGRRQRRGVRPPGHSGPFLNPVLRVRRN